MTYLTFKHADWQAGTLSRNHTVTDEYAETLVKAVYALLLKDNQGALPKGTFTIRIGVDVIIGAQETIA